MENKDNKPTKNQKKTIVFVSIFASVALILDALICLICYYFAKGQFNKYLDGISEDYVVSKDTKTIRNNLLGYLKDNVEKVSPSNEPRKIIGYTFIDHHMNIAAEDNDSTIIFDITTTYSDAEEALTSFKEAKPNVDAYTIDISIEKNDDETFNPNKYLKGDKVIGHTSYVEGLDPRYISFTGNYSENEIASCVHEEYKEDGLYTKVKKANASMHPLLYDFYYLILNN